ncbi:hypothetical protein HMY34_18815 [Thiothrix subterranea]|uniref:hypothetical protein n=1 Tax=Thiothrix subterranea TaxID=2735563 RepID=UPI00192C8A3D|nr:hypothetical protein [Thiothrix subterranea]QQZ30637.1 hypothetical protein HMY34_18815 [Thiothrix subterranea]
MLSQHCKVVALGVLFIATSLTALPAEARLKNTTMTHNTTHTAFELPYLYEKLRTLLGNKLYKDLLQNDEFIILQDLVMTHLENQYPVSGN